MKKTLIPLTPAAREACLAFIRQHGAATPNPEELEDIVAERAAKDRKVMSALDPTNSHIAGLKGGQL